MNFVQYEFTKVCIFHLDLFGKIRFSSFYVIVFRVSVCLCFCCCIFVVLHSMNYLSFEFNVIIDLITQYSQSGKKKIVLFTFFFTLFRSSHWSFLQRKLYLKVLPYSHGPPVLGSLLNKAAALQPCNFIKKKLQHRCFCEIFKNKYFEEHLRTAATIYSEELLKYKNCVTINMLPESF